MEIQQLKQRIERLENMNEIGGQPLQHYFRDERLKKILKYGLAALVVLLAVFFRYPAVFNFVNKYIFTPVLEKLGLIQVNNKI